MLRQGDSPSKLARNDCNILSKTHEHRCQFGRGQVLRIKRMDTCAPWIPLIGEGILCGDYMMGSNYLIKNGKY